MKGALFAGTLISLSVTAVWAWTSAFTIGAMAPLHLTRQHPVASYAALAGAPTGNGLELFGVTALIFAACFLVTGLRRRRRTGGA